MLALPGWPLGRFLLASRAKFTGERSAGGLGRVRDFWGLKPYSHARESRLPKKAACPPVSGPALGKPGWRGMASPGYSALPQALLGSEAPVAPVAGNSREWPQVSHWREWLQCCHLGAGGNLCAGSLVTGMGMLGHGAHLQRRL